ncbi:P-loop NTPase fold protein [Halarcobacter ebronensis]|nr:P-loop NTPase fold protein [Halarcobacter ebronensis]
MRKTEKEIFEDRLKDLLIHNKIEDGIVVSLKGNWGIGKTHFWQKLIEDELKINENLKYAYISLFGKNSLDEIKKEIILKISFKDKVLNSVSKRIKNIETTFGLDGDDNSFGISGSILGVLLSLAEKKDFENVLICFDDFERLSNSLNIKEVLGFISELKEQKNCKILMINNNGELKKSDEHNNQNILKDGKEQYILTNTNSMKIFEEYKEKIVDYDFEYNFFDLEEIFNELYKLDVFDRVFIYNEIKELNNKTVVKDISNIRLLKQYINNIEIFSKYFKNEDILGIVKRSLILEILFLVYSIKKEFVINPYCSLNVSLIKKVLAKGYLVEDSLLEEMLIEKSKILEQEERHFEISNRLFESSDKFSFDINYTKEEYANDIKNSILENKDIILEVIRLDNLKYYLGELKKYSPNFDIQIESVINDCAEKYIDNIYQNGYDRKKDFLNTMIKEIENESDKLKKYVKERREEALNIDSLSEDKIIQNFKSPQENGGWGIEVEILNSISVEKHIEYMKNSQEYFEEAFYFIKWVNGFSGDKPFKETYRNIIEAINKISNENDEMKAKMSRVKNIIDEWE